LTTTVMLKLNACQEYDHRSETFNRRVDQA
jgi:hypothetical protein